MPKLHLYIKKTRNWITHGWNGSNLRWTAPEDHRLRIFHPLGDINDFSSVFKSQRSFNKMKNKLRGTTVSRKLCLLYVGKCSKQRPVPCFNGGRPGLPRHRTRKFSTRMRWVCYTGHSGSLDWIMCIKRFLGEDSTWLPYKTRCMKGKLDGMDVWYEVKSPRGKPETRCTDTLNQYLRLARLDPEDVPT